ncbi:MAG: M48 family metalloprotease [Candidatus Micrarchaeota archaeon]|nr:M48 family metalloprotease [Candidatus Micrarchaeota archaeon]
MILRTAALMVFLTIILLGFGFLLGGTWGMTGALILSFALNFFAFWYSDRIVLGIYGAEPLRDKRIKRMVAELSREAGIPEPKLYVVQDPTPNAFATGRSPSKSAVAVTTGLLDVLDDDEIRGVLSHEIAHIKNRDTLVSTVAAVMAGAIAYLAQLAWWGLFAGQRDRSPVWILLPLLVLAPLAATLVRLAISRSREFYADHTGALISKDPESLASALEKISSHVRFSPSHGNPATSHMWIVNPFESDSFSRLFSTHPPVSERIKRLKKLSKEIS